MKPTIVVLTGGYTPAVRRDGESAADWAARDRAVPDLPAELAEEARGCSGQADEAQVLAAVTRAWQAAYRRSAAHHQVRSAWIVEDPYEAARFAAFITATIDPAYVITSRSPLPELLAAWETDSARDPAGPNHEGTDD